VCILPDDVTFGDLRGRPHLLVVVEPCQTQGKDATSKLTVYKDMMASFVTDILNVKAVIGRVKSRGKWGIVDRMSGLIAVPVFDMEEDSDDD